MKQISSFIQNSLKVNTIVESVDEDQLLSIENKLKNNKSFVIKTMDDDLYDHDKNLQKLFKDQGYTTIVLDGKLLTSEDINGMPIVIDGKALHTKPSWLGHVYEQPKEKFVVLFNHPEKSKENMNNVMNALIPLVLKKQWVDIKVENCVIGIIVEDTDQLPKVVLSVAKPVIEV